MTTDLDVYEPRAEVELSDPTGGRLVAWAKAASAANQLARALATTAFVPKGMTDPGNATAAILMGDELGLSPIASLRSIYVVHGTPAMYARTMVALTQAHGHQVWTEESTPAKVTVCGRRRGSEHTERVTWSMDRARKAGYTSNAKYQTNPEEMLYAKAAAEVCRKIAADVLAGAPYSVEDIESEETTTTTVSRGSGAKRTVSRATAPEPPEPELDDAQPAAEPTPEPDAITEAQRRKMGALMREAGITERDDALRYVAETIGREVESRNDLTKSEASDVIDALGQITATKDDTDPWAEAAQNGIDAEEGA